MAILQAGVLLRPPSGDQACHTSVPTSVPHMQVIPAGARAKFPLVFACTDIKHVSEKLDMCVNGCHMLPFAVAAHVVPVSVDLSSEEVHFEFGMDDWDRHLDRSVQVGRLGGCAIFTVIVVTCVQ
jgi:hypothetical protein